MTLDFLMIFHHDVIMTSFISTYADFCFDPGERIFLAKLRNTRTRRTLIEDRKIGQCVGKAHDYHVVHTIYAMYAMKYVCMYLGAIHKRRLLKGGGQKLPILLSKKAS